MSRQLLLNRDASKATDLIGWTSKGASLVTGADAHFKLAGSANFMQQSYTQNDMLADYFRIATKYYSRGESRLVVILTYAGNVTCEYVIMPLPDTGGSYREVYYDIAIDSAQTIMNASVRFTAESQGELRWKTVDLTTEVSSMGGGSGEQTDALQGQINGILDLLNGKLTGENFQLGSITSDRLSIADGFITNAMISNLMAGKITGGTLDVSKVTLTNANGSIVLHGDVMQFKDASGKVRLQLGRDATGNFTFTLFDASGKGVLIDAEGIKSGAIADGLIVNDMLMDSTIGGKKINWESFTSEFNAETNTHSITSSKVNLQGQSLDVAFDAINSTVTDQGKVTETLNTWMTVAQGQISSLISATTITNEDGTISLKDAFSSLKQLVDRVNLTVAQNSTAIGNAEKLIAQIESNIAQLSLNVDKEFKDVQNKFTVLEEITVGAMADGIIDDNEKMRLKDILDQLDVESAEFLGMHTSVRNNPDLNADFRDTLDSAHTYYLEAKKSLYDFIQTLISRPRDVVQTLYFSTERGAWIVSSESEMETSLVTTMMRTSEAAKLAPLETYTFEFSNVSKGSATLYFADREGRVDLATYPEQNESAWPFTATIPVGNNYIYANCNSYANGAKLKVTGLFYATITDDDRTKYATYRSDYKYRCQQLHSYLQQALDLIAEKKKNDAKAYSDTKTESLKAEVDVAINQIKLSIESITGNISNNALQNSFFAEGLKGWSNSTGPGTALPSGVNTVSEGGSNWVIWTADVAMASISLYQYDLPLKKGSVYIAKAQAFNPVTGNAKITFTIQGAPEGSSSWASAATPVVVNISSATSAALAQAVSEQITVTADYARYRLIVNIAEPSNNTEAPVFATGIMLISKMVGNFATTEQLAELKLLADEINSTVQRHDKTFTEHKTQMSQISQKADSISQTVTAQENRLTTAESSITQLSNKITQTVTSAGVKSIIEQSPSSVRIGFNKINSKFEVTSSYVNISDSAGLAFRFSGGSLENYSPTGTKLGAFGRSYWRDNPESYGLHIGNTASSWTSFSRLTSGTSYTSWLLFNWGGLNSLMSEGIHVFKSIYCNDWYLYDPRLRWTGGSGKKSNIYQYNSGTTTKLIITTDCIHANDELSLCATNSAGSHTTGLSINVQNNHIWKHTDCHNWNLVNVGNLSVRAATLKDDSAYTLATYGQDRDTSVTSSLEANTESLGHINYNEGQVVVNLPEDIAYTEYSVFLSPIGKVHAYLIAKNDDNFIVECDGPCALDYMIKFENVPNTLARSLATGDAPNTYPDAETNIIEDTQIIPVAGPVSPVII